MKSEHNMTSPLNNKSPSEEQCLWRQYPQYFRPGHESAISSIVMWYMTNVQTRYN